MGINEGRLDKRQGYDFAGLPSRARDGDGAARCIVGVVRLDPSKTIEFAAGESICRRGRVTTSRDEKQTVVLTGGLIIAERDAGCSCARCAYRARGLESAGLAAASPGNEEFCGCSCCPA